MYLAFLGTGGFAAKYFPRGCLIVSFRIETERNPLFYFFESSLPSWPINEIASALRLFAQKSKTPPLMPTISFERLKI